MAPVRIVLTGALCVVLAVIASGAFDLLITALLVPPVIITAVWLMIWQRSWKLRLGVGLAAVIGSVAVTGWLVGAGPRHSFTGVLTGPRRLLSTEWPSPDDPQVVVAVASLIAVVSVIAVELASRRRFHAAPVVVVCAGLAVMMAIGAPLRPPPWTVVALAGLSLLLLLARHDDDAATRTRTVLGERSLILTVALLIATLIGSSAVVAWTDRADPRQPEQPEVTAALLDPVEEMVALRDADPSFSAIQLTDRSTLIGPALPTRWRLSALDTYDGQRWVPSLTLRPIGARLGLPSSTSPDAAPPITYDAEFLTDDIDLVPFPGPPLVVETSDSTRVRTDPERTVVQLDRYPEPGMTVRATAEAPPPSGLPATTPVATRPVDEISAGFTDTALTLVGDGTVLEQLRQLEQRMRDEWELDSSAPGAGQQLALIERFLTETRRGTAEQFATGFVLLARSLGVDARVATGFVIPARALGSSPELRSEYAAVWPEVLLDGIGWMPFDPVPVEETSDVAQPPAPPVEQSPAAAQPPIAPPPERGSSDAEVTTETDPGDATWDAVRAWAVRVAGFSLLIVVPVLLVVGTILGIKWRRHRRRLAAPDPRQRIVGAWANATDSLVDAGLSIDSSWTNETIAERAEPLAPAVPHEIRRLASNSTAMTFSSSAGSDTMVDDAVTTWRSIERAIRAERSLWQRIRWRLSLRSLRRRTRSPVT